MGVGKSHISKLLAQKLGLQHVWVDALRFGYYEQIGYNYEEAERLREEKGLLHGLYQYWKPFELYAVERILAEYENCIFDFGAGHSVQEGERFEKLRVLLADFPNVFFLLPSQDAQESVCFLMARKDIAEDDEDGKQRLRYFITHPSNFALAKQIIYVKDKTEEEICSEIIGKMQTA